MLHVVLYYVTLGVKYSQSFVSVTIGQQISVSFTLFRINMASNLWA